MKNPEQFQTGFYFVKNESAPKKDYRSRVNRSAIVMREFTPTELQIQDFNLNKFKTLDEN